MRPTQFTELAVEESGSPLRFARMMAARGAQRLRNYAQVAEKFEFEAHRAVDRSYATIVHEPVGVVAAITPFNSPTNLALQKAGAALAAGCAVVLKAPTQNPLSCYLLVRLAQQAGFPPGTINLFVADIATSEYFVAHPDVDIVTFTGSTAVGKAVMQLCATQVKRCTLELGGKSAAILLADANFDTAVPGIVAAGVAANMGQACTAMSRVLVPRARYADAMDAFADHVRRLRVGDPRLDLSVIGPLISAAQRERVESYIATGIEEGAKVQVGGRRPPELASGWYLEPTVLVEASNDMRVCREEIFGPVTALIAYDGVEEAVTIANDSPFGLAASVWTEDPNRGEALARRLRVGTVGINEFRPDPAFPFGGYKQSGFGRENGPEGLAEFLEPKTIMNRDRGGEHGRVQSFNGDDMCAADPRGAPA